MAKVYITEYDGYVFAGLQAPREPAVAAQTVTIGGTSTQSSAFNAATRLVRVTGDAVFSAKFGEDPTATANTQRFSADLPEYRVVQPGHKVAIITNT